MLLFVGYVVSDVSGVSDISVVSVVLVLLHVFVVAVTTSNICRARRAVQPLVPERPSWQIAGKAQVDDVASSLPRGK